MRRDGLRGGRAWAFQPPAVSAAGAISQRARSSSWRAAQRGRGDARTAALLLRRRCRGGHRDASATAAETLGRAIASVSACLHRALPSSCHWRSSQRQSAHRHFSLGKERNPPALQLKLAARDRNRAAPKAMGGFGTARAVAGVLAASRRQQKATPDGGKSARPRAERSPRSPWSTVVI